jgi:large subunit ribosomal protein L2
VLLKNKISNGTRHQLNFKKFLLCKIGKIKKDLLKGDKSSQSGRSSKTGRITVFHKGGGLKKKFRFVKFEEKTNYSVIISIMYDPRRNALISFCYNFLNSKFYNCLTTNNTFPGSIIYSYSTFPELRLGSFLSVKNVPSGSVFHSLKFLDKSKYIKSSGVFGTLLQKKLIGCKVKMPSGIIKTFPLNFYCVLGSIVNSFNNVVVCGKAGRNRLRGHRPVVRGVAMNPVDHPHGGQTCGGVTPVTPWGIPTRGRRTKKNKSKNKNVKI